MREIGGADTAAGRFVSLVDSSLAIDQSNGNLLVADNTQPGFEHPIAAISEFNAEGLYRGQLEKTIIDGAPVGIAFDESPTPTKGQALRHQRQRLEHRDPARTGAPRLRTGRALPLRPRRAGAEAESDDLRYRVRGRSRALRPGSTARLPAKRN